MCIFQNFSKRSVDESTNISSVFSVLFEQEAQQSPSDRAMRLVSSNLANCHARVQKLLIRQVLTKLMYEVGDLVGGSVMNNVHSTMTRPSLLPLSQVS